MDERLRTAEGRARSIGVALLVAVFLFLPGCGGSSQDSGAVSPTPPESSVQPVPKVDILSAMQSLASQVPGNLPSASPRSLDARIESSARVDCPAGYTPVEFTIPGTGQSGGTATVEGCYADGKPSDFTLTLEDFVFPDGRAKATGVVSVAVNLTPDQASTFKGTLRMIGKLDFNDAGAHSFDIILGFLRSQVVATKAGVDGSPLVNFFPLRLENHAPEIDNSNIFVTIIGKDAPSGDPAPPAHYYYLARPGDVVMTIFPPDVKEEDGSYKLASEKSFALSQMTRVGDNVYQVNVPTANSEGNPALLSGKIFFAVNRRLQGIGANKADATDVTLPSPVSDIDGQTMFEQMELTASIGNDPNFTLFVNATTIDFMSFGPALRVDKADGTHEVIGFSGASQTEPDGSYCVRDDFIKAMGAGPQPFKNYVVQGGIRVFGEEPSDANSVVRVLGPPTVVPITQADMVTPVNPELNTYLDDFIAENWATFLGQINTGFKYKDDFTWDPLAGGSGVSLTCTFAAGTNTGTGDKYDLGPPTTEVVFRCDDPENVEPPAGVSPKNFLYHFYSNSGSDAHKRLGSIILAGFNRGLLFDSRDVEADFYTQPQQKFNFFAKVVHDLAFQHIMYGFGYDDVFGQDGTQAGPIGLTKDNQLPTSGKPIIKLVTIIIPTFKPVASTLPTLSFSPSSGAVGDPVTLTAPIPGLFKGASNVLFDKIGVGSGNFKLDATNTTITTNVPPGAPTGQVKIAVAVPGVPGGQIDSGGAEFQVTAARFTFSPTFAALKDELTVTTFQLPVIAASPTILFPDKDGKEGAVGALMTGSNGVYKVKVPDGNVGSGYLQIPLVGGGVAVSTERFVLKTP